MAETKHNGCMGCKFASLKMEQEPCCRCHYGGEAGGEDMYVPRDKKDDMRKQILHEAETNICGQRELDYGSPESNFGIIANMWSEYLGATVTPVDVAMMMVLLKVARIKNGGGSGDSFVDIAGYAACGGEIWHDTSASQ